MVMAVSRRCSAAGPGAVRTGMSHVPGTLLSRQARPRSGRVKGHGLAAGRQIARKTTRKGVSADYRARPAAKIRSRSGPGQPVVDLPGHVALEDADHLGLG